MQDVQHLLPRARSQLLHGLKAIARRTPPELLDFRQGAQVALGNLEFGWIWRCKAETKIIDLR